MNWLMLRSGALKHTAGQRWHTSLQDCDDMWTLLFAEMVKQDNGDGVIWCNSDHLRCSILAGERMPWCLVEYICPPEHLISHVGPADVIFNRGGYDVYADIIKMHPDAFKIYYGAGRRYNPDDGVIYDLILVDCKRQLVEVAKCHLNSGLKILTKPAAETVFKPVLQQRDKFYDVVFICHTLKEFKGYKFLVDHLPKGTRLLKVGPRDKWLQAATDLDVTFTELIPRDEIPYWACRAKVGIVCDDGTIDSGPRVIPELMAMNIPVLLRVCVRASEAYIDYPKGPSGRLTDDVSFHGDFQDMVKNWEIYKPRDFYDANLSTEIRAEDLLETINRIRKKCTE